jgi:putative NADPH-quinone reductase
MSGRTLVVLAHPDLENSRITAALAAVANRAPGVEVRNLSALYPDHVIDVAAEQAALADVDEVVLQYPTYWYSMPGLLKQWLDDVFVRGWAYGTGRPGALRGMGLRVVTSTGGVEEEYATDGFHGWQYRDILVPLEATARRLGMLWREPLVVHGAREVTDGELDAFGDSYCTLLGHAMTAAA